MDGLFDHWRIKRNLGVGAADDRSGKGYPSPDWSSCLTSGIGTEPLRTTSGVSIWVNSASLTLIAKKRAVFSPLA